MKKLLLLLLLFCASSCSSKQDDPLIIPPNFSEKPDPNHPEDPAKYDKPEDLQKLKSLLLESE